MVQNIFIHIKQEDLRDDTRKFIYRAGKATDYFVLLLEGRARVTHHTSANETLQYEAGPFSYFGIPSIFIVPPVSNAGDVPLSVQLAVLCSSRMCETSNN